MSTGKTGYIHGSDLILSVGEIALGHSKSCEIQNQAETKERAHKQTSNTGKWKEKSVISLSVSVSAEGFAFHGDEMGYDTLLKMWGKGEAVTLKYSYRDEEATCYRTGQFIITNLSESAPSDDDATYSVSFENTGEVKIVEITPSQAS